MFRNLLVPLDGSTLAESVLPAAAFLGEAVRARITLLHIMEQNAPATIHGQPHLTDPDQAEAYLEGLAARLASPTRPVARHVHRAEEGDVAGAIVRHAEELGADLIVLCTHGWGGLRDWLFGSIAQQVLQRGTIPIVLLQPTTTGAAPPFACRGVLVPLEGPEAPEPALPVALGLARACYATLHLVMVVPTPGTLSGAQAPAGVFLPMTTAALLDLEEGEAREYLQRVRERLRAEGLRVTGEVGRGDPVTSLAKAAERAGADLVVLATHGRRGLEAYWSASVAPRLLGCIGRPVLLVRVGDEGDKGPPDLG